MKLLLAKFFELTSTLASEAIEKMVRGLENGNFFFTIIDFWMSDLARAQVHEEAVNNQNKHPLAEKNNNTIGKKSVKS